MFYRLKHYDGILNLDKFTRIEKDIEEEYAIVRKPQVGTTKNISEQKNIYVIRFYPRDGFGNLCSTIRYNSETERDEDFRMIEEITCNSTNVPVALLD